MDVADAAAAVPVAVDMVMLPMLPMPDMVEVIVIEPSILMCDCVRWSGRDMTDVCEIARILRSLQSQDIYDEGVIVQSF